MRTGGQTWAVMVPRQDQDAVPVRIRVDGDTMFVTIGSSKRALVFDVGTLAELVADLRVAGRLMRAPHAAAYIAAIGRERHGPPNLWGPVLSSEEIDALNAEADRRLGPDGGPGTTGR